SFRVSPMHPMPLPFRLRLTAACALLGIALAGLSCSNSPDASTAPSRDAATKGGAIKIGFFVKQPEEPWFQLEWKFAEQAAKELGFTLVKTGANDSEKALAAIDSFAAGGAQGFIICTPDTRLGPA